MSFTLYVARDKHRPAQHDPGSVLGLQMLRDVPDGLVAVVECGARTAPPPDVRGTPTLRDDAGRDAWTGHHAILRLHQLAMFYAQTHGRDDATKHNKSTPRGGAMRAPAPPVVSAHVALVPPDDGDDGDDGRQESMWESTPVDEEEDANEGRKLTSEDLSRAIQQRASTHKQMPTSSSSSSPPAAERG